ncbi:NAD(P)-binding protein [Lacrimispora sp.]|jgi:glycine/D-amino acid oxidase-like deaminating enzyme|uniref:NAD(P)-binding protein n=1 Tax=Lacrimispora sp. TaxID=2719234 RepID=UPI0028A704AA|nr:FAD-dependent oxidoreductase [Lacrimispora sp.]
MTYDKIVIGAGLYGLYSAGVCGKTGEKILVLEHDPTPFRRATYINQARVHMGYHYPRSFSTAIKSAHYFNRFMEDYDFCVLTKFDQVYATSANFSWTNAEQFRKFSRDANIRCDDVSPEKYFNSGMCDGAFLTEEYTYDAGILKEYFLEEISKLDHVHILYNAHIKQINQKSSHFQLIMEDGTTYETDFLLNATYASTNQIAQMLGYEPFKIKYELCEIILCHVKEKLKDVGITVMDGPFFSIMPFGKTGYHSLTSVTFTPHMTCYDSVPVFECQNRSGGLCSPVQLGNCNDCPAKPDSAWPYMSKLAKKYLKEEYGFEYSHSLFSMKPILKASEIDDSRPTVIKQFSENPTFISVLSGKINTVYDLDEVLTNANK